MIIIITVRIIILRWDYRRCYPLEGRIASDGTRQHWWDQLHHRTRQLPGGSKWGQVGPVGTRWEQVGPIKTRWD
jgi:hypothetical protein